MCEILRLTTDLDAHVLTKGQDKPVPTSAATLIAIEQAQTMGVCLLN